MVQLDHTLKLKLLYLHLIYGAEKMCKVSDNIYWCLLIIEYICEWWIKFDRIVMNKVCSLPLRIGCRMLSKLCWAAFFFPPYFLSYFLSFCDTKLGSHLPKICMWFYVTTQTQQVVESTGVFNNHETYFDFFLLNTDRQALLLKYTKSSGSPPSTALCYICIAPFTYKVDWVKCTVPVKGPLKTCIR